MAAFQRMLVSPVNIAICDFKESMTTGEADARQSDPSVLLCFAGDTTKGREIVYLS